MWTRDELKQIDQRRWKLMIIHKALHPVEFVKIVHAIIQLCSHGVAQRRLLPLEDRKDYLLIIWLSTYGHVIAWAVASDCPHTGRHWMEIMAECAIIILYLLPPPSCKGSGLWGGMSSFKPSCLCGSNLESAWRVSASKRQMITCV